MKNNGKNILFYVVLIAVLLVASTFLIGQKKEEPPEYSEIVKLFENGEVESYTVTAGNILDIKTRDQVKSNGITVKGKEITPFLLDAIQKITGGESLEANIRLVFNNAVAASNIAVELAKLK